MSIELGRLCRSTSGLIVLSFETLDPVNNDRLTRDIFQQLLFRFDMRHHYISHDILL